MLVIASTGLTWTNVYFLHYKCQKCHEICCKICGLLKMSPKNQPENNGSGSTPYVNTEADDEEFLAEIKDVDQSLDSLSSALDMIEERADGIKAKLLEILNSNKEIRESMVAENVENQKEESKME